VHLTRHRLAALAATASTLAIGLPVADASAALPALPARLPSLPVVSFPGFPLPAPGQTFSFSGSGLQIATSVGPAIIGKVLSIPQLGNPQIAVAPGVPIALTLGANNPTGSTIANGLASGTG
jgi:hypothetical protein